MDSFMNSTLFGEALLQTDEKYPVNDCSLTYTNSCNTIGIATKKHDGKTIYFVYKIGEHGAIDWEYEYSSFSVALSIAQEKYKHLCAYNAEIERISKKKRPSTIGNGISFASVSSPKLAYGRAYKMALRRDIRTKKRKQLRKAKGFQEKPN